MNLATMQGLLLLVAICAPCDAITRFHSVLSQTLTSGSQATVAAGLAEAARYEAEGHRFWTSQSAALEGELRSIASIAAQENPDVNVPELNLDPKSTADLAPALAMLKALYEDGKQRIVQLNEREKDSKEQFAAKEAQHNATLARIEARSKNGTLSAEFYANETRDENRMWNYWVQVRERQHHQYIIGLNIQHSMLGRAKKLIDMYEATMSGTADATEVAKTLKKVAPPEIVLMQEETKRSVAQFCREALAELRDAASAGAPKSSL